MRRTPSPRGLGPSTSGFAGISIMASRQLRQAEPRVGIAYNIKKTNTVLRISYARTMESPFNENLILSGTGCTQPVVNAIMTLCTGLLQLHDVTAEPRLSQRIPRRPAAGLWKTLCPQRRIHLEIHAQRL